MSDIIAIGGAAFAAEPRNLAIDRYILDLTKKDRPNPSVARRITRCWRREL